jgi:hypothetical protein
MHFLRTWRAVFVLEPRVKRHPTLVTPRLRLCGNFETSTPRGGSVLSELWTAFMTVDTFSRIPRLGCTIVPATSSQRHVGALVTFDTTVPV